MSGDGGAVEHARGGVPDPAAVSSRPSWPRRAEGRDAAPGEGGRVQPCRAAIVVPCFDEEAVLPETLRRLTGLRAALLEEGLLDPQSTVQFVDDGSRDRTWTLIEEAARTYPWAHGIKLSRNAGHQSALLAGLLETAGDAVISLDADLQDDPGAIREMLLRHARGAEIVYGVRRDRSTDGWFKRTSAELYYRVLRACGVDVVFNHADYRLLGRRALEALREFREVNLFVRGIVPQLGFPSARVYYDRAERAAGVSKYPLGKMLALAWNGITSFSTLPLRWITALGVTVSLASFATGAWALVFGLLKLGVVPGWASTVVPMAFLGGIQLLSLGVIGEYVAKVYAETKRRPRYIIEKVI
jgi:glycosyltransferase involved in cell wall biosynthesis